MRRISFLILILILMAPVFAFNSTYYEYQLNLLSNCSEYMGHVEFEFPDEVNFSEFFVYSSDDIFVDDGHGYFYIDDDCNRTRQIYFGTRGENRFFSGKKTFPVVFKVATWVINNPAFDDDFDDDGILNDDDNCLNVFNVNQTDVDLNGVGDACDDVDNDSILNDADNCLNVFNPDQKDIDYNGAGDACDDFDNDGILNVNDNCQKVSNRRQIDDHRDGVGDACDDVDSRFFEQNQEFFILLIVVIVGAFAFLSYKIFKH